MKRGFYGIGIYHGKKSVNIGTLWRSAFLYDADFIFTIGARYPKQASDTVMAYRHIPLWEFDTFEQFTSAMPKDSRLICVELSEKSKSLPTFVHPEQAVYLLGAEDAGLPEEILQGHTILQIPEAKSFSMNVSVAGSIILYDRFVKSL
jgi:tRNA (guanosine-2'-O-)-methyltransferase